MKFHFIGHRFLFNFSEYIYSASRYCLILKSNLSHTWRSWRNENFYMICSFPRQVMSIVVL